MGKACIHRAIPAAFVPRENFDRSNMQLNFCTKVFLQKAQETSIHRATSEFSTQNSSRVATMPFPNNKLAISTSCLGLHPSHSLDEKLRAASSHSFSGVEIVHGDLEVYALRNGSSLQFAAERIRKLCDDLNLEVLSICPFENFEGARSLLKHRLARAERWIELARILKAKYIQVPAQFGADTIGDEQIIISELQDLCDLCSISEPHIAIAYEPMSWSTYYSSWESALHLSNLVDRANFGICIDTFHIASLLYGDPYSTTNGILPSGQQVLSSSLARFAKDFPKEKLFYIQLSDGERFNPPFSKHHPWYLEGEAAQFTWSKWARPFPGETQLGGYYPVGEMVKSLIKDYGFNGWVSLEIFDRRMRVKEYKIEDAADRAVASVQRMGFEVWGESKDIRSRL